MSYQVEIKPSGHRFTVEAGEPLLDAALRQGVGLPYGCRNGSCGSCMGTLLSGRVDYPEGLPPALEKAVDGRQAVFCQARPTEDLVIEVREIQADKDIAPKILPCRAEHIERLSHDVMRVFLKLPASDRLQFFAGQYIEFILKDGRRRAFSIANAPHQDDYLELHIRHVPGGSFTGHVFDEMQDRAMMRIEGPLGSFYLREQSDRPVILMGGGTGFAPLKGMMEHAFHTGMQRPVQLFWGVRSAHDLYMEDLPLQWARDHANFSYTPVLSEPLPSDDWRGATGLVTDEVIRQRPDLRGYEIYMSGPPPMIEAATPLFVDKGAEVEHMYSDAFEFASDVLEKIRQGG